MLVFIFIHYKQMIGRWKLKLDDPPPDLAVETDVTSKTTLCAYEIIGVPEVGIYDNGNLNIFWLREGKYIQSELSSIFSEIPLTEMIPSVVERTWQVGSVQALEEFEEAIAKKIK